MVGRAGPQDYKGTGPRGAAAEVGEGSEGDGKGLLRAERGGLRQSRLEGIKASVSGGFR